MNNYITAYRAGSGWAALEVWWNTVDFDFGFWEPYQSGDARYSSAIGAIKEAQEWAESEGKEFKMPLGLQGDKPDE